MRRALPGTLVLALTVTGCGSKSTPDEPPKRDIGAQTADISSDTKVVGEANAIVGDIIRNQGDCTIVKAGYAEADAKLRDALSRARTSTGKSTIEGLQKQVKTFYDACP